MIILSVGMPRAGSGWHYNLIHALMQTAGYREAREIRERYHLQSILTEVNCNIGVLSLRRLGMVTIPALLGNNFVIKAHAAPTRWSRLLLRTRVMRVTYIYRDPRDAMLSAHDYGQRAIAKGRPNAFSNLTDFEKTLDFMLEYVRIWEEWTKEKDVLHTRFEDILTNYEHETTRLINYLNVNPNDREVEAVLKKYRPGQAKGQQGLHFYKGKVGRFREAYNKEEQARLGEIFGPYLKQMGYAL
jgi:hypothetical protein